MFGDDPVISKEDEMIVMEPPWALRSDLKQNGCTAAAAAIKQTEETDIFEVDSMSRPSAALKFSRRPRLDPLPVGDRPGRWGYEGD